MSLPVQVAQYIPAPPVWLVVLGALIWLTGYVFETSATGSCPGSGKPLTEKRMRKSRPEYAEYADRTSGFFPLPPEQNAPGR